MKEIRPCYRKGKRRYIWGDAGSQHQLEGNYSPDRVQGGGTQKTKDKRQKTKDKNKENQDRQGLRGPPPRTRAGS